MPAGAVRCEVGVLAGLAIWVLIVTAALFVPEGALVAFLLLAVAIGIVLGGTQALSRSFSAC